MDGNCDERSFTGARCRRDLQQSIICEDFNRLDEVVMISLFGISVLVPLMGTRKRTSVNENTLKPLTRTGTETEIIPKMET